LNTSSSRSVSGVPFHRKKSYGNRNTSYIYRNAKKWDYINIKGHKYKEQDLIKKQ